MNFYQISACVYAGVMLIGILLYCYKFHFWKYANKPQKKFASAEQNKKYAVLIPAKDESLVIAELLDSLKAQTYDAKNIQSYVIVADANDPTIEICKNYDNVICYVLPKKVGTKGETLDAMLAKIKNDNLHYDGYFIIDADNVLKPDFIELTHDAMVAGNDVVLGCRLNKTNAKNWVNSGSILTWTFLNTLNNKCRSANGQNIIVQGSPLLISKSIVEDFWGTAWPLKGLTEDYELGFVCSLNNFKSYYLEAAMVYDEQPVTYKQSYNQRLRWIKGHNSVDLQYSKKFANTKCKYNSGIYKYDTMFALLAPIIILAATIIFVLFSLVCAITFAALGNLLWIDSLIGLGIVLVASYLVLCFWTLFPIVADNSKLNYTVKDKIKAFFTVPFFFFSYLPIYIKSFFIKNVKWKKVEHNQKHTNK